MRNLWIFFLRYYAFFLFLLLEVIAFTLIINNNQYQRSSVLNSANQLSGSLYTTVSNAQAYLDLGKANDSLAAENAILKNLLRAEYYSNKVEKETRTDSSSFRRYTYVRAKVVNNTTNKRNNYLTLDRGRLHGIRKNMGVISKDGIVGIVKDVSDHFCTVISFLHKDSKISAKLNSSGDFGSLVWDGLDPRVANLKDIPTHVVVKENDSVMTTGFSSIFPEHIMIGRVKKVEHKSGDNFFDIEVELSTDFSTLRYVYIVSDFLSIEKNKLEEAVIND